MALGLRGKDSSKIIRLGEVGAITHRLQQIACDKPARELCLRAPPDKLESRVPQWHHWSRLPYRGNEIFLQSLFRELGLISRTQSSAAIQLALLEASPAMLSVA